MIDERNRQLAEVTRVDDVIVSDKIISLMLTQISENRELAQVFDELFAAERQRDLPAAGQRLRDAGPRGRPTRPWSRRRGGAASARSATAEAAGADDPGERLRRPHQPAEVRAASPSASDDRVIVLAEE